MLSESERKLMSKIGKLGGQVKSEKKRLAALENLKKANAAKLSTHTTSKPLSN